MPSTAISGLATARARPPAPASPVQSFYGKPEQIRQEMNSSLKLLCKRNVPPSPQVPSPPAWLESGETLGGGGSPPGMKATSPLSDPGSLAARRAARPPQGQPLEGGTATHNAGRIPAFV